MDSINQVLVLSLMMVVGLYARKKGYVDDRVEKGLSSILVSITFPFLIINSFILEFNKEIMQNAIKIFIYAVIIHIALYIISKIIYAKAGKEKKAMMVFITTFSNCAFMGYPILGSIYGDIGLFYASIFTMVFTVFVWSLGVSLFEGKVSFKDSMKIVIKNPCIWAVGIGAVLFLGQIKLPYALGATIKNIGGLTTPLSMMIIGSMLWGSNIKEMMKDVSFYLVSLVSLVITPLLVFFVMRFFNLDPMLTAICGLLVAMPGASIGPVIAMNAGCDGTYGSQCIFVTTVFSIITIPIMISLMV